MRGYERKSISGPQPDDAFTYWRVTEGRLRHPVHGERRRRLVSLASNEVAAVT